MNIVILLAPPAAGKGTQAKFLSEKYNIVHISTGDLLRNELQKNNELSKQIKKSLNQGNLVDDDIILKILSERIQKQDCNNGFILDGFPRNINQALMFDKLTCDLEIGSPVVIFINVSKEIAQSRIIGRLSCPCCGKIYNENIDLLKPKVSNYCDICSVNLVKRSDDNEEVFNNRYNQYIEKTKPLIKYYSNRNNLYIVNGNDDSLEVFKTIIRLLEDR